MGNKLTLNTVFDEINACIGTTIESEAFDNIANVIASFKDKQVVCVAAGRMGYSLRAFAMRLMHIGFKNVSFIGDTNVPYTGDSDTLVIFGSSSGETKTNVLYASILNNVSDAEFAHEGEATKPVILTITCNVNSTLAQMSDYVLKINTTKSVQPMKTVYEQATYLLYDIMTVKIMEILGLSNADLRNNHSILE